MGAVITLPTSLFVCTCCGVSSLSSRALSGTSTPLACDLIRARFEHTTMSSPTPRRHRNARENHDGLSMAPIEQRWTRYPASAPLKGHLGYKGTSHSHLHHTLPLPAPQIPLSSICTSSPRSNPPLRPTPANMIHSQQHHGQTPKSSRTQYRSRSLGRCAHQVSASPRRTEGRV